MADSLDKFYCDELKTQYAVRKKHPDFLNEVILNKYCSKVVEVKIKDKDKDKDKDQYMIHLYAVIEVYSETTPENKEILKTEGYFVIKKTGLFKYKIIEMVNNQHHH